MKSYFSLFVLSTFLLFSFTACGGGSSSTPNDGDNSPDKSITSGVTGVVTDMNGELLKGVTLYSGSSTTTTDISGKYTLKLTTSVSASLTAELNNYARNSKLVVVEESKITTQDIKLAKVDTVFSFDASSGASITAKNAKIELPADGYTLADGTTYTGKVTAKATYNRVTTGNGLEVFPGDFLGQEATTGDTKVLQSYGFIDVTLESNSGDNLKLASGSTAKLTYPMDTNIKETPTTIPLWHYNVTKGTWVEEGLATYDATTKTYVGTVTHFSTWNLDRKFDGASIKGCVEDISGNRVVIADLFISGAGWSKHKVNNDATGEFEFINAPSNSNISLIAKVGDLSSSENNITLSAGETRVISPCLKIDVNASELFANLTFKVVDGDNNPIVGKSVTIYSVKDGVNTYIGSSNTDINGTINESFKRSTIDTIKVTASKDNINFESYYTINPVQSSHDLGTFLIATTTFQGCVVLADGSTQFSTDKNEIAISSPYNLNDYSKTTFDASGLFTLKMQKDNLSHNVYAHTYTPVGDTINPHNTEKNYLLTGKISIDATTTNITKTASSDCIKLHTITDINKSASVSLSSTNSNVHVAVVFVQSDYSGGREIVKGDANLTSATFNIDNNGVYIVKQAVNDYNDIVTFNGTMSVEIDGTTHTITIPSPSSGQTSEWWTAFRIEVYDGTINVVEVNKE
ncbi:MAG: hypothetical protein QM493_03835 [Sulfurovum sp.]